MEVRWSKKEGCVWFLCGYLRLRVESDFGFDFLIYRWGFRENIGFLIKVLDGCR